MNDLHEPIGDLVFKKCKDLNNILLDFPLAFDSKSPKWMQEGKLGTVKKWCKLWKKHSSFSKRDKELDAKSFSLFIKNCTGEKK